MARRPIVCCALVVAAVALLSTPTASAHQRAALTVVSPAEGDVVGNDVEVVVTAAGTALSRVDFTMRLDGRPVDTSGRVGADSVFTTFSLADDDRLRLRVTAPGTGEHELRLVYGPDPDDPRPDVVRRFSTGTPVRDSSRPGGLLVLAAIAVVVIAVGLRRRHLRD